MAEAKKGNWLVDMFKKTSTGKKLDTRKSKIDKVAQPEDAPVKESNETQEYRDRKLKAEEDKRMRTTRDAMKDGFRKGGYVRAADGCAKRGKTRGKMV